MTLYEFAKLENKARKIEKELSEFSMYLHDNDVFAVDKEGDRYYVLSHEQYIEYTFLGYKIEVD